MAAESEHEPIRLDRSLPDLLVVQAEVLRRALVDRRAPEIALPAAVTALAAVQMMAQVHIENFVTAMRSFGVSWQVISEALGVPEAVALDRYRHVEGLLPRGVVVDSDRPRD